MVLGAFYGHAEGHGGVDVVAAAGFVDAPASASVTGYGAGDASLCLWLAAERGLMRSAMACSW